MCFACIVLFFSPLLLFYPISFVSRETIIKSIAKTASSASFATPPTAGLQRKEIPPPHSNQNILLSPKSRGTITHKKLHCVNVKPFVNEDRAIRSSVSSLESFLCVCVFDSSRHNVPSRCLYQVESSSRKKKE